MRTKIGHLGFWASVNYGNGIFITISPGERHNYLSLKLSRYREDDPFIMNWINREWAGRDKPYLEPKPEDAYSVDIPGYDLRRIMAAEDPLAAANAFFRSNTDSTCHHIRHSYVSFLSTLCHIVNSLSKCLWKRS